MGPRPDWVAGAAGGAAGEDYLEGFALASTAGWTGVVAFGAGIMTLPGIKSLCDDADGF